MKKRLILIATLFVALQVSAQPQGGFGGGFGGFGGFGGGFPGFGDGEMPDFSQFQGMGGMFGGMPEGPTGHVDFTSSDLPLIQIDTDSLRINQQSKIAARMKITDNGKGKRNATTDKANNYDGFIGIKISGLDKFLQPVVKLHMAGGIPNSASETEDTGKGLGGPDGFLYFFDIIFY